MALSFDAVQGITGNAVGSLTTASFTIGGSANAFLLAIGNGQAGITVSSCSCGGVSGSSVGGRAINGNTSVHLFSGINPGTGSQTATVTFSDTWGTALALAAHTFIGADTTNLTADYTTATGTGTAISVTVPNTTATDIVIDGAKPISGTATVGANQTARYTPADRRIQTSTQSGADGGVMSWTSEFSVTWAQAAVRILEASGGGGTERHQTRRMIQAGGFF